MRIFISNLWLPLLLVTLQGCSTCEIVEAELRVKTEEAHRLNQQLLEKDAELSALRQTITNYQQQAERPEDLGDGSAVAYQQAGISRISFGRLTGGRDENRDGVDESLVAVISCHDYDGDVFKCPGTLTLTATQASDTGGTEIIGQWTFPNERLRETWRSTLVSQGYQLSLPWQNMPTSTPVRLKAQFVTVEGRSFDIEQKIDVAPVPVQADVDVQSQRVKHFLNPARGKTSRKVNTDSFKADLEEIPVETIPEWSEPPQEVEELQATQSGPILPNPTGRDTSEVVENLDETPPPLQTLNVVGPAEVQKLTPIPSRSRD